MTKVYIVRHAEPDYTKAEALGFWGVGLNFAPLAQEGIDKAKETAKDARLRNAQIIISSPYTRALQTAQIISRHTGIDVEVEVGMHEWLPDTTAELKSTAGASKQFALNKGIHSEREEQTWEEVEPMRRRMRAVLDKYSHLDTIVIVGHEMSLKTLTYFETMERGGILEMQYDPDAPDSEYWF